jgi:hypothetical protein
MTALATLTLGTAQATVTFGSIPATYRDLRLVVAASGTAGNGLVKLQFNGDTSTSNYFDVGMYGDGTTAGSESHSTNGYIKGSISNMVANEIILVDVMDYAQTDKQKTVLLKTGGAVSGLEAFAGRWASTSAVTSIAVGQSGTNTFAAGSTFSLFGILA